MQREYGDTMRIKLGILHSDTVYLKRFTAALETKYPDKLALYSFSSLDAVKDTLEKERIDVLLAEDTFGVEPEQLPTKCGFAYFVDSQEVETLRGVPTVCRFQRAEMIYKRILGLFSESLGEVSVRNLYSSSTKVLMFSTPCGGTGTSTLAASCAAHFAAKGKRCLYLSLEDFGGADVYFSGEGTADMSDVVYAVKSKRVNLSIKLESCLKQDRCGVFFFSTVKIALDMMELTSEERVDLISTLVSSGNYDILIVDLTFDIRNETRSIFDLAHMLVWVSDGLPITNFKIARAHAALKVLCQGTQSTLADRVCLLQNKTDESSFAPVPELNIRCVGHIPKLRHRMDESIIDSLAPLDVFDSILE